ncbi:MAG: response regulator transcription factor [Acidimicrobiia bacterium]|nr:response regulator transcription factor [Acidimicrobiia bacterium]MDH5503145.1 response regulator transcription factor [Acidimicrobiia bacterium]
MIKPKILVVDDERAVAFLLTRSLEAAGCEVTTVDDGLEAYDLALAEPFDVILIDHLLPGLLGQEVVQRWRQAGLKTPVIIVSGVSNEEDIVRSLESGASDYVRKPFSVREIIARVKVQIRDRPQGG